MGGSLCDAFIYIYTVANLSFFALTLVFGSTFVSEKEEKGPRRRRKQLFAAFMLFFGFGIISS